MAQDFEQMLKDVLGDSWNKLTKFQTDQLQKLTDRVEGMARDAMKPEIDRLSAEIADLRERITALEPQRKGGSKKVAAIEPSI